MIAKIDAKIKDLKNQIKYYKSIRRRIEGIGIILELKNKFGMTFTDVGKFIKLNQSQISDIVCEKRILTEYNLKRLKLLLIRRKNAAR